LYDTNADNGDTLALGFPPLFETLVGPQRTAPALSSLFTFISGLKTLRPEDSAQIDALVVREKIAPITDVYGSSQTNFGYPAAPAGLNAVYNAVAIDGTPTNVCSFDTFVQQPPPVGAGSWNKLGIRRFLTFTLPATASRRITVTTTHTTAAADPDFKLYAQPTAAPLFFDEPPTAACSADWQTTPGACRESTDRTLSAGTYVLEVFEWTNTRERNDPQRPPIGRTCFDVTVGPLS
jgi:hypothetical protein